jgi:hypothetical protein
LRADMLPKPTAVFLFEPKLIPRMNRTKSRLLQGDPIASAQKILSLSDNDFAKWLDKVIDAGLRIGRK